MLNLIKKYFPVISCFLLFIFICSKFLKINLIKNFNEFNIEIIIMFLFCFFCLSTYSVLSLIKLKKNKIDNVNKYFMKISNSLNEYYYKPLQTLDKYLISFLKNKFKFERTIYTNKLLTRIYKHILEQHNVNKLNFYFLIYFILKITPKFLILIVFFIDIFFFKQFYYLYWVLPLTIIPLILQYIKYIVFYAYKDSISFLENKIEIHDIIPSTSNNLLPKITLTDYLNNMINYNLEKKMNPYKTICFSYQYFINRTPEERKKNINYDLLIKQYTKILFQIDKIHVIYSLLSKNEKIIDTYVNLIIYLGSFIGWIFVLYFILIFK